MDSTPSTVLFSDLDRTLIYSSRQIQLRKQSFVPSIVVEEKSSKPLSFMSFETWKLISDNAGKAFEFIPTTTRTARQYGRLKLPYLPINYAVTLNGARILVDGVEDFSWTKKMSAKIKRMSYSPGQVNEEITRFLQGHSNVKKTVNADGFFTYVLLNKQDDEVEEYLKMIAVDYGYQFSQQGRKIYLIPSFLDKKNALLEVKSRLKTKQSFAAGDSVLDFSMAEAVDIFIHPLHGDSPPYRTNLHSTRNVGLEASTEIVNFVLNRC